MTDFLLELRSEEIPARMQLKAKDDLVRLFTDALAKAGLSAASIEAFATPRRLALIAKGLPLETAAASDEIKGPRTSAPEQALNGFLSKYGLAEDQLKERDGVWFANIEKPGRKTADVLAEAIPAIIRAFPWPKSQRWGAASVSTESLRWVRPLQGIVALLGDDVVDCEIDGIVSGAATKGHRFHHSGDITIGNAGDYVEKLRACHVIVHFSERTKIIRDGAEAAAKAAGLVLVPDEGLVTENAGLTEWPVPMLGRFDPAFLAVPQEVIQLTARVNQKYFVCNDANGKLANAFVCTANISAHDGGAAIVAGNEKVLAARLSDAKFFWEQDLKVSLEAQAKKLSQITFHEKLGTVADKVERVAKLARWLVEEGIVHPDSVRVERSRDTVQPNTGLSTSLEANRDVGTLAAMAERAARLCKADLVTGMVGEFPELQGIMGGYYARAQGAPDAVADAVRDHYKPVGQGDDVPTAPVTVAVSLADKFDTMASFFSIQEMPSGSKDPYAIRRAAIAINRICIDNEIKLYPTNAIDVIGVSYLRDGLDHHSEFGTSIREFAKNSEYFSQDQSEVFNVIRAASVMLSATLMLFLVERMQAQLKSEGNRPDFIEALKAKSLLSPLEMYKKAAALQNFIETDDGANLLFAYKRAANILKSSGDTSDKNTRHPELVSGSISPNETEGETDKWMLKQVQHDDVSEVEVTLLNALNTAEPLAAAAIAAEQFEDAMAALASLRAPIDAFFDGVMVNDPDPEKRSFRVGLLTRFRDAVCQVADFSRIEG